MHLSINVILVLTLFANTCDTCKVFLVAGSKGCSTESQSSSDSISVFVKIGITKSFNFKVDIRVMYREMGNDVLIMTIVE